MIFGLPTHPLLVHFPVVAIPVLSVAAFVVALRPSNNRTGSILGVFAVVTAVATVLTARSGEQLADLLSSGENIDRHRQLGETLRLFVILQTVALLGMIGFQAKPSLSGNHPVSLLMRAAVGVLSVLAMIWVILTGHEGASQSWGFLT